MPTRRSSSPACSTSSPTARGFLRVDPAGQSRDDVYVSPAQIRRCELRSGDEVSGPVRPPRRNERHPSLVRVETVNGADAEPPERAALVRRPDAGLPDRAPAAAGGARGRALRQGLARGDQRARPAPAPPRCCARSSKALGRETPTSVQVALAGVRPEEVAEWRERGAARGGRQLRPLARGPGAGRRAGRRARQARGGARRARRRGDRLPRRARPGRAPARVRRRPRHRGGRLAHDLRRRRRGPEALRWATTRIVLEPAGRSRAAKVAARRAAPCAPTCATSRRASPPSSSGAPGRPACRCPSPSA